MHYNTVLLEYFLSVTQNAVLYKLVKPDKALILKL